MGDGSDGARCRGAAAAGGRGVSGRKRKREASERGRQADERERAADERERLADERERAADERERAADERERLADERERRQDERSRLLGLEVASAEQRAREAVERSRVLIAAREERRARSEAARRRAEARRVRQGAEAGKAAVELRRKGAAAPPDLVGVMERSRWLRGRVAASLEAFAVIEEEVARVHEEMAARRPGGGHKYRQISQEARSAARRAHDLSREYGEDPHGGS
jgi:hypothetical protein